MAVDPRTLVVVGVGQFTENIDDPGAPVRDLRTGPRAAGQVDELPADGGTAILEPVGGQGARSTWSPSSPAQSPRAQPRWR